MTTWNLLRAAGIGSYVMLFLSFAWGLLSTTAFFGKRLARPSITLLHQFFSTTGLILLVAHMALLFVDPWMPFDLGELLIPGRSTYEPLGVGLGIVSMYLSVVIVVSSWLRKGIGPNVWRAIHLLATPAFAMSFLHGFLAGTDSSRPWMWWLYVGTGVTAVFLLVFRALTARPPRSARAREAEGQSSSPGPSRSPSPSRASSPVRVAVGETADVGELG